MFRGIQGSWLTITRAIRLVAACRGEAVRSAERADRLSSHGIVSWFTARTREARNP